MTFFRFLQYALETTMMRKVKHHDTRKTPTAHPKTQMPFMKF